MASLIWIRYVGREQRKPEPMKISGPPKSRAKCFCVKLQYNNILMSQPISIYIINRHIDELILGIIFLLKGFGWWPGKTCGMSVWMSSGYKMRL